MTDRRAPRPSRSRARWSRTAPLVLVALAVVFNLWVLRTERLPTSNPNDTSVHVSMVQWAEGQIENGRVPLDGWYPRVSLGIPQFHHYQSLPHVVTGYLATQFGAERSVTWTLYLLLATWPLSVYWGVRLLGFDRWTSGACALISPLLVSATGYGYEHGSYTWRGNGVWSQLWGMWLIPLALGLSWRAITKGKGYALAALAIALTIACHFLTGYLALLALGIWVLVKPSALKARLVRAVVVGIGAALTAAWVVAPLLSDSKWSNQTEFQRGTFWNDSYGARKVLGWLVSGNLFDQGRWPVVTVLAAVGLLVCVVRFRRDERCRAVLGFSLLSLLLFFGRPTLGPGLKLLPGAGDIQLHRYIMGVHLAGILLAGIGGAWLGKALLDQSRRRLPRLMPAAVVSVIVILGIVALAPAWRERASYDALGARWINDQRAAESTDGADLAALVEQAKALGGGRVYAGMPNNGGPQYRVGQVPVYIELLGHHADAVGFTLRTVALTSDIESRFDRTSPAQYDLFNIRYVIVPSNQRPAVPARFIAARGRHRLWEVPTSGYLEVVDTVAPAITGDRGHLGQQTLAFMQSPLLTEKQFPTVAFGGREAAAPSAPAGRPVSAPAGTVGVRYDRPDEGVFGGQVVAQRPAVVLLKASYHPRWTVTVDGVEAKTQMVAPAFVGVSVPAGTHTVEFRYRPYPSYPWLLLVGLLALIVLSLGPRALPRVRERLGRRRRARGPRPRSIRRAAD